MGHLTIKYVAIPLSRLFQFLKFAGSKAMSYVPYITFHMKHWRLQAPRWF